ncbi:hypothetical protein BAL199_24219 [alpha proteobacterium BAL199]|nr:hypothetical protein BAL199_24219 [alpha proteobacterium BAL199]
MLSFHDLTNSSVGPSDYTIGRSEDWFATLEPLNKGVPVTAQLVEFEANRQNSPLPERKQRQFARPRQFQFLFGDFAA